jgi:predicted Rossmann fold flavoprotein
MESDREFLRVLVVGGGAAGFFGAIVCAETHPQVQVTLLEAGQQPLAKVRISGGGRCNVTHACFEPALLVQQYPRGGKALRGAFSRFQPRDTIAWFQAQGIALKTEPDGRMFPTTDDSGTIVNCLQETARRAGVAVRSGARVTAIKTQPNTEAKTRFEVKLQTGERLKADRLLLATGSNPQGYRFAQALGHEIISPVPSLFTFNVSEPDLRELAGVSVGEAKLRLKAGEVQLEQTGALLITHWGLSGPAVLKLSAWGARALQATKYQAQLQINWLPRQTQEALRQVLMQGRSQFPRRQVATYHPVMLPQRLWQYLVERSQLDPATRWAELSNKAIDRLVQELSQGEYKITGKGVFKEEFVTCGGVNLKEVDFKTMESRLCPGLFFAGEILDIDGVTGGFNFQSAWTTGYLAGVSMSKPQP